MIAHILGLIFLYLFLLTGFVAVFFALPGTIVIFLSVLTYSALTGFEKVGWLSIFFLLGLVVVAELLELFTSGYGAVKFGASKWGFWGAVIGAVAGGMIGGSLIFIIGAIPGIIVGAFLGAFVAEVYHKKEMNEAVKAGVGATIGRVAAIFAKALIALVMIGWTIYMLQFHSAL